MVNAPPSSLSRAAALACVALASCAAARDVPTIELPSEPPAEDARTQSARLKIGVYLSLSGPGSARSLSIKEGIALAVDEINEGGGIRGRKLEVVFADDGADPSAVVRRVAELIFIEKVVGLLGEVSLGSASGGAMADKNHVPLIAPTSMQVEITQLGSFVFRACASEEAQGRLAAAFAVGTLGKRRVGLLYPYDVPYSMGLAAAFREEAKRLGAEAVIERGFARDETSFAIPILEVMDERPDVIYAPVELAIMARVARTAMIAGIKGEMFLGSDAWGTEDLAREVGEALSGAFFTDHWAEDAPWPASRSFVTRYRERFQREPRAFAALGYDAAKMLADAARRASAAAPEATREGLREAIRDAIEKTEDLQGVTGTIGVMPSRDAEKSMVVRRIERGKAVYYTALGLGGRD
jgi:branched-chain amino acid transport system substrate-binding protein